MVVAIVRVGVAVAVVPAGLVVGVAAAGGVVVVVVVVVV